MSANHDASSGPGLDLDIHKRSGEEAQKIAHEAATKKAAEGPPAHMKFDNSHNVVHNENVGVWFCTLCGCYVSKEGMRRKLRILCTKAPTPMSKYYLSRLSQGLHPWNK